MLITIIIPCYKSAKTIENVVLEIVEVFSKQTKFDYEIILVNDGSPDNTFEVIHHLCQNNSKIIGLNLSKNFGQSAAKMAGMKYVHGNYLVFMDDDNQHPAEHIFTLINKVMEGYDMVYANFNNKKHSLFKKITSDMHNWLLYKTGSKPKDIHLSSFLAMNSFCINAIKESNSPVIALAAYLRKITTKIANVDIPHQPRTVGKSGYTLKKLFSLWRKAITSFNTYFLNLIINIGVICVVLGIFTAIVLIVQKILNPNVLAGYTSIIAILLLIGGMIMLMLGIVGEYIGKIYLILCKLPAYKIRDVIQIKNDSTKK